MPRPKSLVVLRDGRKVRRVVRGVHITRWLATRPVRIGAVIVDRHRFSVRKIDNAERWHEIHGVF